MSDPVTDSSTSSPSRLIFDGEWKYRGYHGCPSVCHLRLFEPVDSIQPLVAVFTELAENPGTSVTNRIEVLATMVWQWQERPERGLTVVEHYPNRGRHNPEKNRWEYPEQFDLVTFSQGINHCFVRPKWRRISRQEVEERIGQTFSTVSP